MNWSISQQELEKTSQRLRRVALTMIYEAQSGHPGGSLSCADIIAALYFREMNIDPNNPQWEDRDRFILSKGHVCPILYAALGLSRYFPEHDLHTLRQEGSILQGHPDMKKCPGIDISTGSLGQGGSVGVGMALAAKRDGRPSRVFVMVGDGESNEGQLWEAIMSAHKFRLDNYILIMDNNGLQLDGACDTIMPNLDMSKKLEVFGYDVVEIDGHNMGQIMSAFDHLRTLKNGKPKFINAHTIKGKGVSYMENQVDWHGIAPNKEQYELAMAEIEGA